MSDSLSEMKEISATIQETQTEIATSMEVVSAHLYRSQQATNFSIILGGLFIALVVALIFAVSWKVR
jgi:hypothetical protein